jgi:hypothetical protein
MGGDQSHQSEPIGLIEIIAWRRKGESLAGGPYIYYDVLDEHGASRSRPPTRLTAESAMSDYDPAESDRMIHTYRLVRALLGEPVDGSEDAMADARVLYIRLLD